MAGGTPGCRHHCSFPSARPASPHLKSAWPSRRDCGGDKARSAPQPQVQICSPIAPCSPQVCQTAHLNLGKRWAVGAGASPGLPGSQLASGRSKRGGALGRQVFRVGHVPLVGILVPATDDEDGTSPSTPQTYAQSFIWPDQWGTYYGPRTPDTGKKNDVGPVQAEPTWRGGQRAGEHRSEDEACLCGRGTRPGGS